MSFNIFAGGRRLAWLGAAALVAFVVWRVFAVGYESPHTVLIGPDGAATPFSSDCPSDWTTRTVVVPSPSGSLPLGLCAPYPERLDEAASRALTLLLWEQLEAIEKQRRPTLELMRKMYAGAGVAALAVYVVVVWLIGWVVRGFLGIPRGMDRKPDASPPQGS